MGSRVLNRTRAVWDDPLVAVGQWVKVSGKLTDDGSFAATEISSFGNNARERIKLRGPIQSIDVDSKRLTIMGLVLGLTDETKVEDLTGRALTTHDLSVMEQVILYAKPDTRGVWEVTRIKLTDRLNMRWHAEGTIRSVVQLSPEMALLEIGPLRVTIDRYTYVIDIKHRAARVVPFDSSTWQPGGRQLIWSQLGKLDPDSGYGNVARQLILALERRGVDITIIPTRDKPARGFERFYKPIDHWGKFGFYYHWWFHPSALRCERVINHSLWDTDLFPQRHVDEINAVAVMQYVPCRQNLETFRDCGVRVPIKILHYGIDPERFPYLRREPSDYFTFGTFGDLHPRKGIDVLLRAFQDEFRRDEPVRLLLKSTSSIDAYMNDDPRLTAISARMTRAELLELLRKMDAFVMPSRGEGFGLCGLEAMATGLPLIATSWGGPPEYLDSTDSFPLSYRIVEAGGTKTHSVANFGPWAEPDYEHLRHLMRWVYEHPDEAARMGRAASARVHEYWTWDRVARQVVDDLDALVAG